ncbi:hypothetical protein EYF80_008078 [Liparis tanakae]|uniref:Uncharacterized protein n=1 Tax=Liparis tanakae TaxID=230148 RepID=A0A4Z2IWH8_9TELE|nr:hypothetical protein EYF80_008078 [Liparis tanakae]
MLSSPPCQSGLLADVRGEKITAHARASAKSSSLAERWMNDFSFFIVDLTSTYKTGGTAAGPKHVSGSSEVTTVSPVAQEGVDQLLPPLTDHCPCGQGRLHFVPGREVQVERSTLALCTPLKHTGKHHGLRDDAVDKGDQQMLGVEEKKPTGFLEWVGGWRSQQAVQMEDLVLRVVEGNQDSGRLDGTVCCLTQLSVALEQRRGVTPAHLLQVFMNSQSSQQLPDLLTFQRLHTAQQRGVNYVYILVQRMGEDVSHGAVGLVEAHVEAIGVNLRTVVPLVRSPSLPVPGVQSPVQVPDVPVPGVPPPSRQAPVLSVPVGPRFPCSLAFPSRFTVTRPIRHQLPLANRLVPVPGPPETSSPEP